MSGKIFRTIGSLLIAAILLLTVLGQMHGSISSNMVNDHTLALAYLAKNKDDYGKCARSISQGDITIGDVVLERTTYNMPEIDKNRLHQLADDFKAQTKQQCSQPIADYIKSYETYERTEFQIAKDRQSLLDKLLGTKPTTDTASLQEYNPKAVESLSGAINDFTFTKADVENYFTAHL